MRKDEVINKLYKEINHPPLSYDLSIVLNNTDSNISNILNIKSYKNITDENLNLHTIKENLMNPYQHVISIIGRTLSKLDEVNM